MSILEGDRRDSFVQIQNPLRFQQVPINLASIAIKYTPQGSTVHMSTNVTTYGELQKVIMAALSVGTPLSLSKNEGDASDEELVPPDDMPVAIITVRDEGQGIASDVTETVFAKFSQSPHIDPVSLRGAQLRNHLAQV
jgi:signal transduction histidine kinase